MPEQLGLDQVARDRRHVDGDELPATPFAVVVKRAGDQFLAGAGLARNHDREVGLHQTRDQAVDFLHRRRTADQRNRLERLELAAGGARTLLRFRQRATDDGDQLLQIERLGQILVGATLGRADGREKCVLRAHDEHRQIGPQLLDPWQKVERVLVGHHHVGDDEVALALADPTP